MKQARGDIRDRLQALAKSDGDRHRATGNPKMKLASRTSQQERSRKIKSRKLIKLVYRKCHQPFFC